MFNAYEDDLNANGPTVSNMLEVLKFVNSSGSLSGIPTHNQLPTQTPGRMIESTESGDSVSSPRESGVSGQTDDAGQTSTKVNRAVVKPDQVNSGQLTISAISQQLS